MGFNVHGRWFSNATAQCRQFPADHVGKKVSVFESMWGFHWLGHTGPVGCAGDESPIATTAAATAAATTPVRGRRRISHPSLHGHMSPTYISSQDHHI